MKALVKSKAEPGLWLEDVPEPEYGINDVLIRVLRTGICGTDVHIYRWDAWAQRTIPVPLVIGHEFVGEIVAVGSNVNDFHPGDLVSGEGHVVCGRCRNCLAGRRHLCAHTQGVGVNRAGAFAELIALPMTNIWHHWPGIDEDVGRHLRPVRQRRAHRAGVPGAGRGRADHRRRADRLHGGSGGAPRRRPPRRRHRPQPATAASWPRGWARRVTVDPGARNLAEVQRELGMNEGFDVGLEMSGSRRRPARDAGQHVARRPHRHARHPHQRDRHRLDAGRLQHADDEGHLRPRDVRDLVPDDGDAAVRPRHRARDHPPLPLRRVRGGLRGGRVGRPPARCCWTGGRWHDQAAGRPRAIRCSSCATRASTRAST